MASDPIHEETQVYPAGPYHRWDRATKRTVGLIVLLFLTLVVYQFRSLLRPLLIAFLLAFILNPIVDFMNKRVGMHRGLASGLLFFLLCLALLGALAAPVTAVPSATRAILSLQLDLKQIISDIGAFFERPIEIAGFEFDLSDVYQELSASLRRLVESLAQGALDVVLSIASGAFWVIFVLVVAFYLVRDAHRIAEQVEKLAPPGYRQDVTQLRMQIAQVWNAFLRGQLVLGTAMAVATAVVDTAIGLPYAWALGLFAGVMELVPNIGPYIAAVPAVLLALIRGSMFLPLRNLWFAVLVAGLYLMLQLIENNFFVPRILGRNLKVHPLAVMIGILAGGQLAGILGILLAAPTLATFKVLGTYILNRLYDRDPFPGPGEEQEETPAEPKPTVVEKVGKAALEHLQKKVARAKEQYSDAPESSSASHSRSNVEAN
jgi:predicted PurR-regulated permease PerM